MSVPKLTFGTCIPWDLAGGFRDFPDVAREAEELGYDRVSVGEHLMYGDPPRPTVLSIPAIAAAGGATRHIRLLAGIVLLPLYNPVMLAKLVATLDLVTGGRLDLGIGVGGQGDTQVEFQAVGVPMEERGRRANESLKLMKRLWTEERVTFEGRYYSCQEVTLAPPPVQHPYPPIWVGGREEPAMRRAALHGDGWYPYLYTASRFRASVEQIQRYAAKRGRDLSSFHWGLLQPICIADSKEDALRIATAKVGQRYETPQRNAPDIAQALCIVGTAKACISEVEERVEAGARDIVFQCVALDHKGALEQMRAAATKVLPYFRG